MAIHDYGGVVRDHVARLEDLKRRALHQASDMADRQESPRKINRAIDLASTFDFAIACILKATNDGAA